MKWTTRVIWIDIETGEKLLEAEAKANYVLIKQTKFTHVRQQAQRGTIEFTNQCRKREFRQLNLWEEESPT